MKYNSTKNNMKLLLFVLTVLGSSNAQLNTRCNTPNGELANCISIRDCQILLNAVLVRNRPQQQTQFLQASSCGTLDKLPLVCCGTRNNYGIVRSTPIVTTEVTLNWNALPSRERCGKQVSGSRILGGQKAGLEEFPWMALLEYRGRSGASTGHSCGGVLINSRYVLTAAHCIVGEVTRQVGQVFQVRLGEYDVNTAIDCTPDSGCADSPLDIPVEERIAHNEYNDNSIDRYHDIGLLRLSRDAPYTSFIRPICLPTVKDTDITAPGERLFVAGWGRMENNSYSPVKLKLAVPVVELTSCVTKFRNTGATVSSRQLCAGGELGKDSCRGDSGGPLMNTVRGSSNQWYVEGIVSFGVKCGTQDMPGVYTKVSEYMPWILANIRN